MKLKLGLLLTTIFFAATLFAAPPVEEGKTIFQSRCAACHNIHKVLTGPALGGVDKRRSIEWIVNFVHSSQTVIKGGDKEAVALFKQFNNFPMPDHKDLSDGQIKNVVEYIKAEADNVKKETTEVKTADKEPNQFSVLFQNKAYRFSLFAVLSLLTGTALFATRVSRYKKVYFDQKNG